MSEEDKIDMILNETLRSILKRKYPDDYPKIITCIETMISQHGRDLDKLEEELDNCLKDISAVNKEDREELAKGTRSFIHVGGG